MIIRLFTVILIFFTYSLTAQTVDGLPLRIRVGTYNVGHFNQGRLGGFQGTGKIVSAELNNWKKWIGQQGLDILVLNEWNEFFDKDSVYQAKKEILDPFYSQIYFGKSNRWIYNGIAANLPLKNVRQKNWDGDYYALLGDLIIGNKTITVISTHIPWQKNWHQRSLVALIKELKKYEYFICMGDINAADHQQQLFIKSGFNMANGGAMGWFGTAASTNRALGRSGDLPNTSIDNIITSNNIKIMRVSAPLTGLNDLDHLPILADLVITW